MGDTKLCLLLLLCTYAFAQEDIDNAEEESAPCLLAGRFKSFSNYVYQYETEALNGVSGTSNLRNGAKATCKVEIDVPQACSYIVRTSDCTLSEVIDIDPEGLPVYGPAAGADAFQTAMEKHPLKLTVEGASKVSLFPEEDEPINVLNIKRGIISALLVPVLEEESNKNMPTVHGLCKTDFVVNTRDATQGTATHVTVSRDLSNCDAFSPNKDIASPLALISGLHIPLSKLIRSTQACNYKFDSEKKHMTEGTCTEKHILLPFSHQEQHGVLTMVKQTLALQEISMINDRVFDHNEANLKALPMEAVEDKSPTQTKDAILATLRELSTLSHTNQGNRRANLFQKLVTEIRGLKSDALSPAVPEMVEVSGLLTWQALAQCGTPECSSAILQILRTMDKTGVEVDAAVYAMGLLPNPTNHLVQDMLSMAEQKPSKPILYGLSNIVRRVYKTEGKVTPEITAVSEYMASLLGDCSGDKDQTFLTLRVIGNMGQAMEDANSALKSALLQCMTQPAATSTVQQAAIQAFRKLTITEEVRGVLLQTVLDGESPIQKRVAAYLVLMKNPEPSDLAQVISALPNEQDPQAKSFVASHLANILSSTDPASLPIKEKITEALQGNEVPAALEFSKFSRNYKMSNNLEGNVIFDSTGYLPKEIMLETTLKAFGYDLDILEVGLDGKGFEPTFEALFGQDGFFPDTLSKALYWAGGKMPASVNTLLQKMIPPQNGRMKRQVPQNILREISRNVNKLMSELRSHQSPDALVYLKLLGSELGFIKTNEMEEIAYSAATVADNLLKMFPTDIMKLISRTDNEFFIHYIFMDNEFSLPTASGVPLKVSLSGTIAPGAKGGLHLTPGLEISLMPSIGVEFVTKMGVHIPEFVISSGVAMHTNIYHESALNAQVAISNNKIKLTLPAPQGSTRLLEISNRLLSVTSTESKVLPPIMEGKTDLVKCIPALPGIKSCITLKYPGSSDAAPYFPLTGETDFVLELEPTGQVTEYTASIAYELQEEGEVPEKVDALKITLVAEGAEPTEATAILKYHRNKHVVTTDVQIPDFDMEAGVRLGITDDSTSGKGIMIEITHKNIPQISLIGHAKLEAMKDGMLQVQLAIPSLKTDATVSAALKRAEDLTLEIEGRVSIPETTSVQKVIVRYDDNQIGVELKSDLNSELHKRLKNIDEYQRTIKDILLTATQTGTPLDQILSKSIEATNKWLGRAVANAPASFTESLRQIHLPEKLFLKFESAVQYKFNQKHITIPISVPMGGKSSEDFNIPHTVTIPNLAVPKIGLVIPSTEVSIPRFSIPPNYELSLPLVEMEVTTKVNSNFYNWEGLASIDAPAKKAEYKAVGDCPMEILSYTIEGTGELTTTPEESFKAILSSFLSHKLIDARVSLEGVGSLTDKIQIITNTKVGASSPLGLETSLHYTTQSTIASDEFASDGNLDGTIKMGSLYANATSSQVYMIYPFSREVRGESTVRVDSTIVQAYNRIKGTFANGELAIMSSTNLYNDFLKHVGDISFKDSRLSVKSDAISTVLGGTLRNQVELAASVDSASIRVESHAEHTSNRAFSLLSGSLTTSSMEMNTEGSLIFGASRGSHKATMTFRNHNLATSGTTTLQSVPVVFESVFSGGIDETGTTLSIISKGSMDQMKIENTNTLALTSSTLAFHSQTDNVFSDSTSFKHDITVDMKPLYAAIKCSTTGKILGAHLIQNTGVYVAGLSSEFNNEIRLNTQAFHLDSTLRTMAAPFSLSVDSIFNSDSEITLFGKHTGQLYSKLLLKAETLAVAFSHDCRASTTHQLDLEATVETHFENKISSLLTPQEQTGTWRLKSELNNHAYNQEISIYNQPERLGVEVSGIVLTDLLNKPANENQEFSISSFLKYDKNSDSHVLRLPYIENLPAIFEHLKASLVHVLESLIQYVNREEFQTRLERLPQAVTEFVREQDLENKIIEAKEKIVTVLQEYTATPENFEALLESVKMVIETIMKDVTSRLKGIIAIIKRTIENGVKSDILTDIIATVLSELNAINERFEITATIVSIISTVEDFIWQVDLEKLKDSSLAWLQELDFKYDIRATLQDEVSKLKQALESFDLPVFLEDLKNFAISSNVGDYIEQLVSEIPIDTIIRLADSMERIIITCIQELKITDQVNAVYTKVRDIIVEYEVEKKITMLLEKFVELIKLFKIEDTVQAVVNTIRSLDLPTLSDKAMQLLDATVNHLKTLDVKQIIDLLNEYIDFIVKKLKSFDYNTFIDEINPKISQMTSFVNEQIQAYGIQQKIEAVQTFVRWIQASLLDFALPESSLPEIGLPDFTIPKLNLEKFDITLQIPEITLPSIPSELIIPAFGKLHGEIILTSPHYNVRTSAELQNSTTDPMTPQITAYLTSQAKSTAKILDYVLDVTASVGFRKLSRIIVSETIKFTHSAASVEHQGSVTIYGLSAQASSKTTAKATTEIYTAELVNSASFASESGFSVSMDTTYNHHLNLELFLTSSEVTLTQNAICRLDSGTIIVAHGITGKGKLTFQDYSDEVTHKSDLDFSVSINSAKMTFTGNTNGESLKMKQTIDADGILFKYITFKGRAETEAPFIKSSLVVVNGNADMGNLKFELKGSQDAELDGVTSGTISNSVNLLANPSEVIFDFQNKGNAKVDLLFSMSGDIDLQNDYAITLNAEGQHINWVALSRVNQYKYSHNLTLDNNKKEIAISATVNGEANLNILTLPLDIPEVTVPWIGVQTPALYEVSLWENTGLKTFLTTTEQTIDINLLLQHVKNPDIISIGIDPITIPNLGNLIFDLTMKSPVFSLNANAALQNQEDIIGRLSVSSTSLFDILKGKLDGITTMSRKKRGIKVATSVFLEHMSIEGTHDITINLNSRAMEASVATVAKVTLPILNLEFNQELLGSTKAQANMDSKMKMKFSFNLPLIYAIGKGNIEHNLALEGLSGHIYLDTSNKGKIEGTILASGNFAGALNNEANIHLDANGLRSSLKTDANSNGNFGETNIWSMDLNEHLALEASQNYLDVGLNVVCNNEVNMAPLNTKGRHFAKGTFELGPFAKLRAKLDVDMSQPSSLGEASILQNIDIEITTEKQKLSLKGKEQLLPILHTCELLLSRDQSEIRMEVDGSIVGHAAVLKAVNLPIYRKSLWDVLKFDQATSEEDLQSVKGTIIAVCSTNQDGYMPAALSTTVNISSPIYSTTLTANLENNAPAYSASLMSACSSPLAFLAYDLDATVNAKIDNGALSLINKGSFSHRDLRMDLQHTLSRMFSYSAHIINVDISCPTLSDMNFRLASGKDRISIAISEPTSGFLGLQLSQSAARIFARYPSEPESDVQILIFKKAQTALNKDAVNDMLQGLKKRVPAITASLYNTADKYHSDLFDTDIKSTSNELKNILSTTFEKFYSVAPDFPEMNEIGILFRSLLDEYQATMKIAVDAVVEFLRNLQLQVPGFEDKLTLPELSHKIMNSVAAIIDIALQRINDYLEPHIDSIITHFSNIKVSIPGTDEEIPASQVLEKLKSTMRKINHEIVGMVRHLESPDVIVQKLAELTEGCARKAEELIGSLKSGTLDVAAAHINTMLSEVLNLVKTVIEKVHANLTLEQLNDFLQYLIETIRAPLGKNTSTDMVGPAAENVPASEDILTPEEVPVAEEVPAAEEVVTDLGEISR